MSNSAAFDRGVSLLYATEPVSKLVSLEAAAGNSTSATGLDALNEHLDSLETTASVIERLGATALTTTDTAGWITEALEALHRASLADTLRNGIGAATRQAANAQLADRRANAYHHHSPAIAGHIARLTKHAERLPANNPLDAEAALRTQNTKDLAEVLDALQHLGTLTAALPEVAPPIKPTRPLGYLCHLLAIPTVEPTRIDPSNGQVVNPDPRRDEILGLLTTVAAGTTPRRTIDDILVAAARRELGSIFLQPATDRREAEDRADRLRQATQRQHVVGSSHS